MGCASKLVPVPVAAPLIPRPRLLRALTALLYYTAGITKKKTYPGGGEVLFRAAASTGALYQTEVYVIAGEVDGLEPGLYHFCPGDFTLRQLRYFAERLLNGRSLPDLIDSDEASSMEKKKREGYF